MTVGFDQEVRITKRQKLVIILAALLLILIAVTVLRFNAADQTSPGNIEVQTKPGKDISEQTAAEEDFSEVSEHELKEKLVDPILAYYPGTAGSSLKRAVAAVEVLSFAAEYGVCDVDSVPAMLQSEEETVRFYENLAAIDDLLKETEADFPAISGLYDDAGVYDTMNTLAENERAWNSVHILISRLNSVNPHNI